LNTELISISSCIKELKISISKEEFDNKYYQELKSIQAKIQMPGFRPGRVPVKLIEKQYGPAIKSEIHRTIVEDCLKEFYDNNDVPILGTSAFDVKENEDGSQVYSIKFETTPDFELKDYKSLEIFEPYHKVTDEEVEMEINRQARQLAKKEETDIVADYNHIVTVDTYVLDNNTKEPTDEAPYDIIIDMQEDMIDSWSIDDNTMDIRDKFLNKKISDVVDHIVDNEKNPNAISEKYIIKKIEKITPCETNDEFAKLASENKFDNIEDYKQEVGFSLQRFWDYRTHELMEEQIISKVTELHDDIEVPAALTENIKEQMIKSNKQKYPDYNPDENKEYLDAMAQKIARVQIVQSAIIKKEKIELEDYDYENFADDFLTKRPDFSQYITRDMLVQQLKTDETAKGTILKKKYVDFLLDFTKTNEIDYDDYHIERINKKNYNQQLYRKAIEEEKEILSDDDIEAEMFEDDMLEE